MLHSEGAFKLKTMCRAERGRIYSAHVVKLNRVHVSSCREATRFPVLRFTDPCTGLTQILRTGLRDPGDGIPPIIAAFREIRFLILLLTDKKLCLTVMHTEPRYSRFTAEPSSLNKASNSVTKSPRCHYCMNHLWKGQPSISQSKYNVVLTRNVVTIPTDRSEQIISTR